MTYCEYISNQSIPVNITLEEGMEYYDSLFIVELSRLFISVPTIPTAVVYHTKENPQ